MISISSNSSSEPSTLSLSSGTSRPIHNPPHLPIHAPSYFPPLSAPIVRTRPYFSNRAKKPFDRLQPVALRIASLQEKHLKLRAASGAPQPSAAPMPSASSSSSSFPLISDQVIQKWEPTIQAFLKKNLADPLLVQETTFLILIKHEQSELEDRQSKLQEKQASLLHSLEPLKRQVFMLERRSRPEEFDRLTKKRSSLEKKILYLRKLHSEVIEKMFSSSYCKELQEKLASIQFDLEISSQELEGTLLLLSEMATALDTIRACKEQIEGSEKELQALEHEIETNSTKIDNLENHFIKKRKKLLSQLELECGTRYLELMEQYFDEQKDVIYISDFLD